MATNTLAEQLTLNESEAQQILSSSVKILPPTNVQFDFTLDEKAKRTTAASILASRKGK
ncbi:hypothetical protein FHS18_004060 [Paenibacillus phyllosphaerae]|uniref:Uncharacterized protein n=1 Tax=Paenibacillus phyllosphaerae TaxID=274593 RepID=A0A7W5B0F7_9BACL|nr:hypothetical protein [Paenibacillus phyllosphaerae]MBB3111992.1 hypothetical protein [Paenibacillus phyllosphaerae]